MKGIMHVEIANRDAKFKFDLFRNITIVRGDSGTGKTTLFDMVSAYTRLKEASGVNVSSTKRCVALVDIDWRNQLRTTSDSIVFIDEGAEFIKTKEFANAAKKSNNYYVIFNRESLHALPYSVEEIYEIKTSGRYHTFKKIYKSNAKHMYSNNNIRKKLEFDVLLTEDSKSGYQFYRHYFEKRNIECQSSESNSTIFKWLLKNKEKKIYVIGDGAAFGSEIDRVLKLQAADGSNFRLCLPESFEWLILKSGLIKTNDIDNILNNPSDFIESAEYFSWENFFESYLVQSTDGTPFHYAKKEINRVYLIERNSDKIMAEIYPV